MAGRIGEILLLHEAVEPWVLTHTLQEQPGTGQRLVSLLISRAQLDPDAGTLALAAQLDYPGARQRHLERADRAVLDAIPAELGRRWVVLPLGRSRSGGLVVVARDPTPFLAASLSHVAHTTVELAVTPAAQLERLVRAAYGELEVGPVPDEPAPRTQVASQRLAVHELRLDDDAPALTHPRTVSRVLLDTTPDLPRGRTTGTITRDLDGTLARIAAASNRAAAEQHVLAFAARQWSAALLASVEGGVAVGRRGHGERLGEVAGLRLPLEAPSILQLAVTTGHASTSVPASALQARLSTLLGDATAPVAAPVVVDGAVLGLLAVGDPVRSELRNPAVQLGALADALAAAYERLAR